VRARHNNLIRSYWTAFAVISIFGWSVAEAEINSGGGICLLRAKHPRAEAHFMEPLQKVTIHNTTKYPNRRIAVYNIFDFGSRQFAMPDLNCPMATPFQKSSGRRIADDSTISWSFGKNISFADRDGCLCNEGWCSSKIFKTNIHQRKLKSCFQSSETTAAPFYISYEDNRQLDRNGSFRKYDCDGGLLLQCGMLFGGSFRLRLSRGAQPSGSACVVFGCPEQFLHVVSLEAGVAPQSVRCAPQIKSENSEGDRREGSDCPLVSIREIASANEDETRPEIRLRDDHGDSSGVTFVKFLVLGGILVAMYAAFKWFGWLDDDDDAQDTDRPKRSPRDPSP